MQKVSRAACIIHKDMPYPDTRILTAYYCSCNFALFLKAHKAGLPNSIYKITSYSSIPILYLHKDMMLLELIYMR